MTATAPQPGHSILSIACPVVSLGVCVGSSCPGTQKLGGVEAPLKQERNLDEFFLGPHTVVWEGTKRTYCLLQPLPPNLSQQLCFLASCRGFSSGWSLGIAQPHSGPAAQTPALLASSQTMPGHSFVMSGLPSSLPPFFLLSIPLPMRPSSILLLYGEAPAPASRDPLTHCPGAWPCTWCGSDQSMTCVSYLVSPDYMQPP